MSKQDRQGARTPADLEYKYQFGKSFREVMGIADDARSSAEDALLAAQKLDEGLTSEEIFNRLTQNGALEGIYRDASGQIYVNASYIKSGELIADLITAGVLKSKNGSFYLDMENGTLKMSANGFDALVVNENGARISGWAMNKDYFGNGEGGFNSNVLIYGESAKSAVGAPSPLRIFSGMSGKTVRKPVEFHASVSPLGYFEADFYVDYIPSDTITYELLAIFCNGYSLTLSDFDPINPLTISKRSINSIKAWGKLSQEAISKYEIIGGNTLTIQISYDSYVPAFQVLDDGTLRADYAVLGGHNIADLVKRIEALEAKGG